MRLSRGSRSLRRHTLRRYLLYMAAFPAFPAIVRRRHFLLRNVGDAFEIFFLDFLSTHSRENKDERHYSVDLSERDGVPQPVEC